MLHSLYSLQQSQDAFHLFNENNVDLEDSDFRQMVFNLFGLWYREENPRRAWSNVGIFEDLFGYVYNLFWHNMRTFKPFLQKNEYIRIPFKLIEETFPNQVSYFVWKQFLDFGQRYEIFKVKRMEVGAVTHIQIQWRRLKSFAALCLTRFAYQVKNKIKILCQKVERKAKKNLIKVDLPDWFDEEHSELFERFLRVRYERQHKASNEQFQQEQLDLLTHLHNDGVNTIDVMKKAIVGNPKTMNGWDRFFDPRYHQERPEHNKRFQRPSMPRQSSDLKPLNALMNFLLP